MNIGGTNTSAVVSKLFGWFREANSPWVKLNLNSRGNENLVGFTYTGDNTNWALKVDSTLRVCMLLIGEP